MRQGANILPTCLPCTITIYPMRYRFTHTHDYIYAYILYMSRICVRVRVCVCMFAAHEHVPIGFADPFFLAGKSGAHLHMPACINTHRLTHGPSKHVLTMQASSQSHILWRLNGKAEQMNEIGYKYESSEHTCLDLQSFIIYWQWIIYCFRIHPNCNSLFLRND